MAESEAPADGAAGVGSEPPTPVHRSTPDAPPPPSPPEDRRIEGPDGIWTVRAIGWGRSGWARDAGAPLLRLRFTPAAPPDHLPAPPDHLPRPPDPSPVAGPSGDGGTSPPDGGVPPSAGPAAREILTAGYSLDELGEDALAALLQRARTVS